MFGIIAAALIFIAYFIISGNVLDQRRKHERELRQNHASWEKARREKIVQRFGYYDEAEHKKIYIDEDGSIKRWGDQAKEN
jgi:hypothetical protein